MSKKGIIIDVGFKADIKEIINDIEKDLKKVNFDSVVGLSDAFDKQAKDVKEQLSKLKREIDETINGKVPNEPNKQIQSLNKAVGVLSASFKELLKCAPSANQGLVGQLDEIIQDVNQVTDLCGGATKAIKGLSNATKGGIQFVDTNQKKELEETFKLLERGNQTLEKFYTNKNKHGNQPYVDEEDALRDIIAQNEIYEKSLKEIRAVEEDTTLSSQERIKKSDKLYSTFAKTIADLARTINSYDSLGGDLGEQIDSNLTKSGSKSLEKIQSHLEAYYNQTLQYIAQRKAEIQKSYYDLGGEDLQKMFVKNSAKGDSIKIPLSISTRSSTILNKAIEIINIVNDKLVDHPIELEVKILSTYKSKSNQKILNEISDSIQNIDDEEIKSKVLSLIDNINKRIDEALLFNVNVNTERALNEVKKFVQDAKDELNELSKNLLPLEPEVILTEEHKQAFQKQLNEAKGEFKIQVGIMDGDDTVDNNATKKELSYLKLLRERVEEVSNAVNEKSLAFIDEEGIVKDVVTNEREYVNQLYADLLLIESQIKDIIESFKLIPEKLKINLDDEMMQSLNNLANHEALSKISDLKKILSSSINSESGVLIEIPEDQKNQLLKDIQKLSTEINTIFETKDLDNWTSKFLSSLSDISQKIKLLFGNNALTDMIEEWNFSDELMKKKYGNDHLKERAAIIDDKGNIYGSGTYDQHGSTGFSYDIMRELKSKGISPKVGIHSHSSDRIVAQSTSQNVGGKLRGGDIGAFFQQYLYNGLEKQLTVALNDIAVFDAKGFYDSNKSIDFSSYDIQKKIAEKKEELSREILKSFYKYFEDFVAQYGIIDKDNFKNSLLKGISNKGFSSPKNEVKKRIEETLNPQDLLDNFFKNIKENPTTSLSKSLVKAFSTSLDHFSYEDIGLKKDIVSNILKDILQEISSNAEKILKQAFNISEFDFYLDRNNIDENGKIKVPRDLATFNLRQITPRILEEALSGEGYNNNYQDFMKVYSKEDFIKQNPLGLSSGSLSDLFDNSAPTNFLETLNKIVEDLREIKDFASSDIISNAFNIKIDQNSLNTFIEEINKLIESIEKLPKIITNAFSSINNNTNELLKEQNKLSKTDSNKNTSEFNDKANAFKTESKVVDTVINSEVKKLSELENKIKDVISEVEKKTESFKEEGKVVGTIIDGEIKSLSPLQNLESTYNEFKKFYNNNDLESEAGAQAALSYYNAYKEALESKVNKKDLQPFTFGKMNDLFTGNYKDYKKGLKDLDLSGLNSQISKYQEIIDKFNQPEVISIINALTEAIQKLLDAGNTSEQATKLLTELNKAINNLSGKNSADKIAKIATNLENFQKSISALNISDNGFIQSLSSILEKGDELKTLSEVLKSTKKQIDATGNAIKAEVGLSQAQEYLGKYEDNIREAVNKEHLSNGETLLYQRLEATKDGLVQIIALIKDANDKYKQFVYTTTDGSNLKVKTTLAGEDPALAKFVKQWEIYQKEKDNLIPGVGNWGEEGKTFTPDSKNWDQLVDKAKEFGIEVGNIVKVLRNVDRLGNESFQIFTKLSRITIARNSNGVLFQNDQVLNKDVIEETKRNIKSLQKELQNSFKGNDLSTDDFLKTLEKIGEQLKYISHLNDIGVIDNDDIKDLQNYYDIFKTTISSISLDKISTDNKTPEFIEQFKQAENQLLLVKNALDKVNDGIPFTDDDIAQIEIFISKMRDLNNLAKDKGSKLANTAGTQNLLGKIADVLSKNTAMSKKLRQEFEQLSLEIKSFGDNLPADKLVEFGGRFKYLERIMKETGQTGLSFFDGIIKRAKSMSQSFISMYLSLWDIVRYVRTGLTYIKELNTALTEMRKVSNETISSLKNFQSVSFDIANSVGTTAVQIQNSTADWMRLGESLDDASESARVSNILLNVSEFESIDEATESLVSMSAAYDELDKIDIVDKLNQVGNNFSISTDGLATALQRSASALTTAGNDMDEAVALVTAGNAVVQDPDSVGAGKLMPEHIVICGYLYAKK